MNARSVVLVEPRLVHGRGHHLGYVIAIANELSRRGNRVTIAGPTCIERDVVETLREAGHHLDRVFEPNPLARFEVRGGAFVGGNIAYARAIMAIASRLRAGDRVIAISGDAEQLAGAAAALLTCKAQVSLDFVMYGWELDGPGAPRRRGLRRRLTLPLIRRAANTARLRLWGQTRPICADIAAETGLPVGEVPMVVDWSQVGATRVAAASAVRVGFMGEARAEKGFAVWVDAMERMGDEVEVGGRISRPVTVDEQDFAWQIDRLRRAGRCRVKTGASSAHEYYAAFAELDVVVLPYAPSMYAQRTSNILVEALGLGVVPLVARETWLSDYVRDHGLDTTFDATSPDSLVEALRKSIDHLPALRERVAALAPSIRQHHNVEGFVDALGLD